MRAMMALLEEVLGTKQCVGEERLGGLSQRERTFLVRVLATKHELFSDGCQSAMAALEALQHFRDRSMDKGVLAVVIALLTVR